MQRVQKKYYVVFFLLIALCTSCSSNSDSPAKTSFPQRTEFNIATGEVPILDETTLIDEPLPLEYDKTTQWVALYNVTGDPVDVFKMYVDNFEDNGLVLASVVFDETYGNAYMSEDSEYYDVGCYKDEDTTIKKGPNTSVSCKAVFASPENDYIVKIVLTRGKAFSNYDTNYSGMRISALKIPESSKRKDDYYSLPVSADAIADESHKVKLSYSKYDKEKLFPLPTDTSSKDYQFPFPKLNVGGDHKEFAVPNDCDHGGATAIYRSTGDMKKSFDSQLDDFTASSYGEEEPDGPDLPKWESLGSMELGTTYTKWKKVYRTQGYRGDDELDTFWIFESDSEQLLLWDRCGMYD